MKKIILYRLFCLTLIVFSVFRVQAQVWPGDISNNGIVNHIDFLYWGYAFGETGLARPAIEMGIEFEEKLITGEWGTDFPGTGLDFVYADCDGDGIVDFFDRFAIEANYNLDNGNITPDNFDAGIEGTDPQLHIVPEPDFNQYPQNFPLPINIELGSPDIPIDGFYGIAFTLRYDPSIIEEEPFFFINSTWIDEPDIFTFIIHKPDEGLIEVATTRSEVGPVDNVFGPLATVFFVIEDDVVGMSEPEVQTTLYVENIHMIDGDFTTVPVAEDSIVITIIDDLVSTGNLVDDSNLELFPNPSRDYVHLRASHNIEMLELCNSLGQKLKIVEPGHSRNYTLPTLEYPPGIYYVKVKTEKGWHCQSLIIR